MKTQTKKKYPKGISYIDEPGRNLRWCYTFRTNGKRTRIFSSSLDLAVRTKNEIEGEATIGADKRMIFDAKSQNEYRSAKAIVGDVSLTEVAMFWVKHANLRSRKSATVSQLVNEVLEYNEIRGVGRRQQEKQCLYLSRFAKKFGKRDVSTLTSRELVDWILSFKASPSSNATVRSVVLYALNRAKTLEYLSEVPTIDGSLLPKEAPKPVVTLTIAEAKEILRLAVKKYPQYIPGLALRMFCGLRTAEAEKMRWEWIDVERKRIVVPAEVCKTRDAWVLQAPLLPETAFKWLSTVPPDRRVGLIPKVASRVLSASLSADWKHNALRHTFCTMHISLEHSADKTALLLRHRGAGMMYRHYLAQLVTEDEAKEFFGIVPETI